MKQQMLFTLLITAILIIAFVMMIAVQQFNNHERDTNLPAHTQPTLPSSYTLLTATSSLYNPTTLALPGPAFPCEYQVNTLPTPTTPGVFSITPDKPAGIGNIINKSLNNPFMKDFKSINV
jgi:hypothetical protein